jgi:hypothetical protein
MINKNNMHIIIGSVSRGVNTGKKEQIGPLTMKRGPSGEVLNTLVFDSL